MSLPQSVSGLAWSDITYDIPLPKQKKKWFGKSTTKSSDPEKQKNVDHHEGQKRILHGMRGHVRQGEFLGILGSSGAGKTTLLNILSARIGKVGSVGGTITYNGQKRNPSTWKRTVGYVEQDDAMLPRSTVRETITYASKLRLPNSEFSKEDKAKRVEDTLRMLRLEECADTRVGGALERGVSGGERKRASIAMELVSDVSLLFLDESTSGLDAFAAESLIHNMYQVTRERNLACCMTIHQPSWSVFTTLDRVILLARGGVYYDGPPEDTIPWFESLGFEVPVGMNPADYFISITEKAEESDERGKIVEKLIRQWKERKMKETNIGRDLVECQQKVNSKWPTPWLSEFQVLFMRNARETYRDLPTIYATIGQNFIMIIIGFAFFRLKYQQSDILPKVGVLFFIPVNSTFSVLFPIVTTFPLQRALMKRERSSSLYRTSSFYLAKLAFEVPMALIQRIYFYVIIYCMIGLRLSPSAFFIWFGINQIHLLTAITLALAIGAVSPTIDIANIIAPFINVIFLLFGGTFIPSPPPWFIWLKWISPITYTFSALVQNDLVGQEIYCDQETTGTCYATGQAVVAAYNSGIFSIAECAGFLFALALAFLLVGYLFLRYTAGPKFRF